jgi:integrase
MTTIRLKYIHEFVDRHGKVRRYFRRHGYKQVPLPDPVGSAAFNEDYAKALNGKLPPPVIGANRTKPGTFRALTVAYFKSAEFLSLKPITQKNYRGIIEASCREFGDDLLKNFERRHIKALLARKVATPVAANRWLQIMKILFRFAVDEEMCSRDPTIGIKRLKNESDGFHTWTEEEIAKFEAHHPIETKARLAFALLLYTAQRRSDVVKMSPQDISGDTIQVRQQKTGAKLKIPIHPELRRIIDAAAITGMKVLLVTRYGEAFTAKGFGNWFRSLCDDAGLPKHCAAHGLRKAACRRLAEAGCSANVIASISGHRSWGEVTRYTASSDQEKLARIGIEAISRTRNGKPES